MSKSVRILGDPYDPPHTHWNRRRYALADTHRRHQLGGAARPAVKVFQLPGFLASPRVSKVTLAMAAAELLGDKLPVHDLLRLLANMMLQTQSEAMHVY